MAGRLFAQATQRVRYGIEQYFVPQRLESLVPEQARRAHRRRRRATTGFKGLVIDGKLEYQEPLF